MGYKVNNESIEKFRNDRNLLPYNDSEIAERMQIAKSYYSSYKNERHSISIKFLRKFYTAFDQELSEIKKQKEQEDSYNNLQNDHEMVNKLNKKYTDLAKKYHKVLEERLQLMQTVFDLKKRLNELRQGD